MTISLLVRAEQLRQPYRPGGSLEFVVADLLGLHLRLSLTHLLADGADLLPVLGNTLCGLGVFHADSGA